MVTVLLEYFDLLVFSFINDLAKHFLLLCLILRTYYAFYAGIIGSGSSIQTDRFSSFKCVLIFLQQLLSCSVL